MFVSARCGAGNQPSLTRSMSATIAAIRRDTESVASEIDAVESGFAYVDDRLSRFRAATAEFLTGFAA